MYGVMLTRRTVIGIVAGAAIIGLATASMIIDLTGGPLEITETYGPGESTSYQISGDAGAAHTIRVTGERFEMELTAPGEGGAAVPNTEFAGEHTIEWTQEEAGRTHIVVRNTGGNDVVVYGTLDITLDPIRFAYHLVVITSGVVIIGFSLAFSLKKPRGF